MEQPAVKLQLARSSSEVRPVTIACKDLSFFVDKTPLLRDVNLLVEPGELLMIVGPSGAGKSTLLNHLAFRVSTGFSNARTGQILLNGHPAAAKDFRSVANYVMTDGRMLPYLTVYETLLSAAKLKLPHLPKQERVQRVERVMYELGLVNCRDTYIGGEWKKGISTGEKKRVCIAIELLSDPSLLVLDEPTSGLDSTLACELLWLLQRLARAGRTIICSVHQPTSQMYASFDRMLLLAKGSVVYYGNATTATNYFSKLGFECPKNYNPADYLLSLVSDTADDTHHDSTPSTSPVTQTEVPAMSEVEMGQYLGGTSSTGGQCARLATLVEHFNRSDEKKELLRHLEKIEPGSAIADKTNGAFLKWRSEVSALYWRSIKNSLRNPVVFCVLFLVQALQGIILGGIFWQLSAPIAGQTPFVLDTAAIVENPWTQLFIHGMDGDQPLLKALEDGVDGKGSQPLFDLINDQASLEWVQAVLTCAMKKVSLKEYPDFGVRGVINSGGIPPPPRPNEAAANIDELFSPVAVLGNLIGLAQAADYLYLRQDWSYMISIFPGPGDDTMIWWLELTRLLQYRALDPLFVCAGYPAFKSYAPQGSRELFVISGDGVRNNVSAIHPAEGRLGQDEETQKFHLPSVVMAETGPAAKKRKLITVGDTGIEDALVDLLGVGGRDMIQTSQEIFERIRSCDNKVCKWIDDKYNELLDLGQEAFDAVMVVVNILGALFFAVANLGFASYDALLTFPQERALFNRDSANGLYRASSYFLAKNLADLPFQLLPSFVLVTIYYFFVGLGGTVVQYVLYALICAAVTFAAYGFGYLVSAVCPRMEIAVLVAPVVLVIWLTIAGFFLRDSQIPNWIGWFSYLSFYKWGFFSLVINQFPPGQTFGLMANSIPLLMAGITETRVGLTFLYLLLLGFLYRVLAFCALKYTNRQVGLQS